MLRWLGESACHEARYFGAKAANLSKLAATHRVPPGFAVSAEATSTVMRGVLPATLALTIREAYERLSAMTGDAELAVAVRSSAIDEDRAEASFAGQHETFLNVRGCNEVIESLVRCVDSARTPEVMEYRRQRGLATDRIEVAVLVQALVAADSAAVVFSANPINGSHDEVVVNSSWGLGESIVGGTVTPDTFVVNRKSWEVMRRDVAKKTTMTVRTEFGTREVPVPRVLQDSPSLSDDEAVEMAQVAVRLEAHMGWPADVECAVAGKELFLLQCRPITQMGAR